MVTLEEAFSLALILVSVGLFFLLLFWGASLLDGRGRGEEAPPVPETPMWNSTTTKTYKPAAKKENKT